MSLIIEQLIDPTYYILSFHQTSKYHTVVSWDNGKLDATWPITKFKYPYLYELKSMHIENLNKDFQRNRQEIDVAAALTTFASGILL